MGLKCSAVLQNVAPMYLPSCAVKDISVSSIKHLASSGISGISAECKPTCHTSAMFTTAQPAEPPSWKALLFTCTYPLSAVLLLPAVSSRGGSSAQQNTQFLLANRCPYLLLSTSRVTYKMTTSSCTARPFCIPYRLKKKEVNRDT